MSGHIYSYGVKMYAHILIGCQDKRQNHWAVDIRSTQQQLRDTQVSVTHKSVSQIKRLTTDHLSKLFLFRNNKKNNIQGYSRF